MSASSAAATIAAAPVTLPNARALRLPRPSANATDDRAPRLGAALGEIQPPGEFQRPLLARRVSITVNPQDGFLAISVTDVVDGALARQEVAPVPLFTAEIALNAAGEMTAFGARGPFLEQARNEALGNAVLEHPEWSDADAWRFMLSLGGRDTTAAAPIGTLDLADGPTLLGTSGTVTDDAALSRNASASADKASVSKLGWTTSLRTTTEKGTAAQFKLIFEPFGGRLIQVTRE